MMKLKFVFSLGLVCGLMGCALDPIPYSRPQPQSEAEIAFMKSAFDDIQKTSFANNREYCGYLVLDGSGEFALVETKRGRKSSCAARRPDSDDMLLASFHTHGAYSEDHDSEYPSEDDVYADIEGGHDGYIATPGGRLWYINGADGLAALLCGAGCVSADPEYKANEYPPEEGRRYSLEDLDAAVSQSN